MFHDNIVSPINSLYMNPSPLFCSPLYCISGKYWSSCLKEMPMLERSDYIIKNGLTIQKPFLLLIQTSHIVLILIWPGNKSSPYKKNDNIYQWFDMIT